MTAVAGPELWDGGQRPVRVASPGVDQAHFHPSPTTAALLADLGIEPGRYLLFPHRPDPDKGFEVALAVLQRLRERGEDIRLLVPTPPQSVQAVREREQRFIHQTLHDRIRAMGLSGAVVLHPWVAHHLLPAYYSLAECCLAPSRLPEGFGLSVLQAVSCGTPVVATPAGAVPDLLPPDHGVRLVPFDNVEATVAASRTASKSDADAVRRGREFIGRHYRVDQHADAILEHLTSTTKSRARYQPGAPRPTRPAPWWRETGNQARWHDYLMRPVAPIPAEQRHLQRRSDERSQQPADGAALARGLLTGQLSDHEHEADSL